MYFGIDCIELDPGVDTELTVIDDCKSGFSIESLFSTNCLGTIVDFKFIVLFEERTVVNLLTFDVICVGLTFSSYVTSGTPLNLISCTFSTSLLIFKSIMHR